MIRIGPAGWDYPDWQGVVYPPRVQGTDRLTFLTQFFPVIEINVTFYRPISATLARRWVEYNQGGQTGPVLQNKGLLTCLTAT
jgi:uncharacterized protein YecE (DUF72 family)